MYTQPIFRLVICSLIWLIGLPGSEQSVFAQPYHISANSLTANTIEFTIVDVDSLPGKNPRKHFRIFWDYGDGTTRKKEFFPDQPNQILYQLKDTHTYETGIILPVRVRAEITEVYTPPDEDNLRYAYPIGPSLQVPPRTASTKNLHGKPVRADRARNPRKGFGTAYVVTYDMDTPGAACDVSGKGGILTVEYGPGMVLDPSELDISMWSLTESFHFESTIPGTNKVEFIIPQSNVFSQREVVLNFHTPVGFKGNRSFVSVMLEDINEVACGDTIRDELSIQGKEEPYDPNFKTVQPDTLSSNEPQLLTYFIQCQNTGKGETHTVRITDTLDYRLDPTSLKVLGVWMGFEQIIEPKFEATSSPLFDTPSIPFSFDYQFNRNGHKLEWVLDNVGKLHGTQQAGFGDDFVEKETIAQIEFQIQTYCLDETNLIIPNQASIYFNSLDPIVTAAAYLHKVCCQVSTPVDSSVFIDLMDFIDTTQLAGPYSGYEKVSLTTDTITNPLLQPEFFLSGGSIAGYIPGNGFVGMDVLTYSVNNGTDTAEFKVAICVGLDSTQYACDTTSCPFSVGVESVHWEEQPSMIVSPNPFQDRFFVKAADGRQSIWEASLYDLNGKLLVQKTATSPLTEMQLETAALSPGLYVLRVNQHHMLKVLKQ